MAKWKLFSRLKSKDEGQEVKEFQQEELSETIELEKPILAEQSETLYAIGSASKKSSLTKRASASPSDQRIWRDVDAIGEKIDKLQTAKTGKTNDEFDKKIDKLISNVTQKHRKPANVIYVVSKPQPGEVRGDWAVRSHSKIYSHHKTKENAIDAARKIAREKNSTVMVQNTDGTFSEGFKPRP